MRRRHVLALLGLLALFALIASPAAAVDDDRVAANATLTSGETYCEAQEAFFGAPNSSANATYRVTAEGFDAVGGSATREVELDANATAVVPTNDLEGDHVLRNESGTPVVVDGSGYQTRTGNVSEAAWEVLDCNFNVLPTGAGRTAEVDRDGGEVTFSVRASNDSRVYVRSERLADGTMADLTGGTVTENGTRVPIDDGELTLSFPSTFACRTGDYRLAVEGVSTGAETTETVTVTTDTDTTVVFDGSTTTTRSGEEVGIGVQTRCERGATVRIGNDSARFFGTASLSTARENDYGELRFDTAAAGSAPPRELFGATFDADLANATVERRPAEDALPPGEYGLTVFHDGTATDAGTLRVRPAETPTPTPTVTPTPTPTATPTATDRPGATTPTATPTPTPTATPSPTPTPAGTAPSEPTATATPSPQPVTATDGQPGFGTMVALAALVAAALLAGRQRD
jgi:PGF-CTERM protein